MTRTLTLLYLALLACAVAGLSYVRRDRVPASTPTSVVQHVLDHCLLPASLLLMAQEPGNPGHKMPPPGWVCNHGAGSDKDKPCTCHRECKDEDELDENGEPTGRKTTRVKEDPQCSVWCFKDHCLCGVSNCD